MVVQMSLDYEQVVGLVEQLSEEQQNQLIAHVLQQRTQQHPLTADEKIRLFDTAKLHLPVNQTPSLSRADWYGDDGR
jgi:predicted aminopeptidase